MSPVAMKVLSWLGGALLVVVVIAVVAASGGGFSLTSVELHH